MAVEDAVVTGMAAGLAIARASWEGTGRVGQALTDARKLRYTAAMPALIAAALIACLQPSAVDGDNVRCGGVNMRVIGVNARESDNSCRTGSPCPPMTGSQARQVMERLIAGGLRYQVRYIDPYDRPVIEARLNDGRDLSCALIASGAVVRWDRYWPEGKVCPA